MTVFDQLFFSVFSYYKKQKNKHANRLASWYITILQSSILLLLGIFFAEFFKNLKLETVSRSGAWTLFGVAVVVINFNNWIRYSGRRRLVLKANYSKSKPIKRNIVVLWMLPIFSLILAIILLQLTN